MNRTRSLKGHCTHCDGLLEFPAESTGTIVDCPLCGQPTELLLARPVEEPTIPRATLVWTLVAVLVLGGGLVGALIALNRAERLVRRKKNPAPNAVTVTPSNAAAAPTAASGTPATTAYELLSTSEQPATIVQRTDCPVTCSTVR